MMTTENPYAAPRAIKDPTPAPRVTIAWMLGVACVGIVGGAALGAVTNCVNGALSPQYFRDVMSWYGPNIWVSAVAQGVLEGALYGLAYAIFFIAFIATISRWQCRFRTALHYAFLAFLLTFFFWMLGGLIAVAFARSFPQFCDARLFGDRTDWPARGCYAWVRGSIWGGVFGGLCSVFLTGTVYALRRKGKQSDIT